MLLYSNAYTVYHEFEFCELIPKVMDDFKETDIREWNINIWDPKWFSSYSDSIGWAQTNVSIRIFET